jgi:hypothetical protein
MVADADDERLREAQRLDERSERPARVVAELERHGSGADEGRQRVSVIAITGRRVVARLRDVDRSGV